jgi:hypothetical protein
MTTEMSVPAAGREQEDSVKPNVKVMLLAGGAWAFIGLGLMMLHFGYVPPFSEFLAITVGLLLAGMLTTALLLRMLSIQRTMLGRWAVQLSYLLFAPIGLLTALLAPMPMEGAELALRLLAPFLTALLASLAVALGMGLVGLFAVGAHQLSERVSERPVPVSHS